MSWISRAALARLINVPRYIGRAVRRTITVNDGTHAPRAIGHVGAARPNEALKLQPNFRFPTICSERPLTDASAFWVIQAEPIPAASASRFNRERHCARD